MSDEGVSKKNISIPLILATGAVQSHLTNLGLRKFVLQKRGINKSLKVRSPGPVLTEDQVNEKKYLLKPYFFKYFSILVISSPVSIISAGLSFLIIWLIIMVEFRVHPIKGDISVRENAYLLFKYLKVIAPDQCQRPLCWTNSNKIKFFNSLLMNRVEGTFIFVDIQSAFDAVSYTHLTLPTKA